MHLLEQTAAGVLIEQAASVSNPSESECALPRVSVPTSMTNESLPDAPFASLSDMALGKEAHTAQGTNNQRATGLLELLRQHPIGSVQAKGARASSVSSYEGTLRSVTAATPNPGRPPHSQFSGEAEAPVGNGTHDEEGTLSRRTTNSVELPLQGSVGTPAQVAIQTSTSYESRCALPAATAALFVAECVLPSPALARTAEGAGELSRPRRSSHSNFSSEAEALVGNGTHEEEGTLSRRTDNSVELSPRNSVGAPAQVAIPTSTSYAPQCALPSRGTALIVTECALPSTVLARTGEAAGELSRGATPTLDQWSNGALESVRKGSVAPQIEAVAPSSELPSSNHERRQKQLSFAISDSDRQTPTASSDYIRISGALAPLAGTERQVPLKAPSANQSDIVFHRDLHVPVAATQDDIHVALSDRPSAEVPADLAFALRLKPLNSTAIALPQVASALPASHEFGAKAAGMLNSSASSSALAQPVSKAHSDLHNNSEDSSRKDHAADPGAMYPSRSQQAGPAQTAETPTAVQNSTAHVRGEETRVASLVQSPTSPVVPESPEPPKAPIQPMPAAVATSADWENRPATSHSAREISLQVSTNDDQKVDVRLVERAGEIHVSVRTPDSALAHEMRQDLGSLTGKLAQSGYSTEHFTPLGSSSSSLSAQRTTQENQDSSRGQGQASQHGGSGQQQQPQDERGKRPAWVEEMENSLAQRQANRSAAWLLNR